MNKVLGIIAEYNPFHNGHLYHLNESKKRTNCNASIAIISGNFTQRGSTSIVNKWEKAKIALENGIDLVIELPTLYAISSAENFADGAIKILNSLNTIDYISFGTEEKDSDNLEKIAEILINEPAEYKQYLSNELKRGLSFPKCREIAISKYLQNDIYSNILSSPNNILGIEYLKSLKKRNSNIKPICISRFETDHNSSNISNNIASSTTIRTLLKNNNIDDIKSIIPDCTYSILRDAIENGDFILSSSNFEREIIYTLRKMSIEEINKIPDVSEGLEFLIKKAVLSSNKLTEIMDIIKSKRYTQTRINRIFLYALLGVTKQDMEIAKNTIPYIRVLGFNDIGKNLISEISKNNPNLKIITSVKKFIDENTDTKLQRLIDIDILATNIYTLRCKSNSSGNLDFKNKIIKI